MAPAPLRIRLDERGCASLDGEWQFLPGDATVNEIDTLATTTITVPGLWEAQGWVELDGPAWYRLRFQVDEDMAGGWWTLRFGAVMDTAEVYLDGAYLGDHDTPFTPFEFDVTSAM